MSSAPADQVPSAAPHGLPLHHSHVPLTAFKLEVGKKKSKLRKDAGKSPSQPSEKRLNDSLKKILGCASPLLALESFI